MTIHASFMQEALRLAQQAKIHGEVPVAAIITNQYGQIIAKAHNLTKQGKNPLHHAEMRVIADACARLASERLVNCDLYVTLEPCAMCAAAISHARLRRLIFAAYDIKGGAVEHGSRWFTQPTCHHVPEIIGGIQEEPARLLLQAFFQKRRKQA